MKKNQSVEGMKWLKWLLWGIFFGIAIIPNIDTLFEMGKEVGRALAQWF
ncbi:hypothetical protein [Marinilactibacillus kalidii]|nr:hypothetical protein [Marinilactibacillus kalidii]